METLDKILSGRGEAVSETQPTPETQAPQEPAQQQQPEQNSAEQPEQQTEGQKTVPLDALHAEKQKSKRYTEEVSSLRQEIAQRDAAWERRIAQLMEAQKPPQEAPDYIENPHGFVNYTVQPQLQQIQQQVRDHLLHQSKDIAEVRAGEDKVREAELAFSQAFEARTLEPVDYQRVINSPNVYLEAVKWHENEQLKREIQQVGGSPAAYKEKLRAELLAEIQQNGNGAAPANGQAKAAPVMPSNFAAARNVGNRSGPAWGGPPTIADIFNRKRQPNAG